ncbi:hypothetical protein PAMP_004322 [Pampus punctatissimus]
MLLTKLLPRSFCALSSSRFSWMVAAAVVLRGVYCMCFHHHHCYHISITVYC